MGGVFLAIRTLRKTPGFAAVAIVTLALGVGANIAIFSALQAVVLHPLPYRDPGRLVKIAAGNSQSANETIDFTTTHDLRSRSRSFQSLSLFRGAAAALVDSGDPELLAGMRVNYDYFETLGVPMAMGRSFLPEEDHADRRYEAILSYGLWQRRFGGDPNVLGRTVRLSDTDFRIVGVLPRDFRQLFFSSSTPPELYLPLGYELTDPFACRGCQHLQLVGRLKPGVSPVAAQAELTSILHGVVAEHPKEYPANAAIRVTPLRRYIVGNAGAALWILMGAVGFVLLIACANVANLMLARATARRREMAVRSALGAGRWTIIRQLLTESLLLAVAGGIAGVALAYWGTDALAALAPDAVPRLGEIRIDAAALLFAVGISVATAVLFGLAPALRLARVDWTDALKALAKATETRSTSRLRSVLVGGELALAFVLALGAALLGRSFVHLIHVDAGFDPRNVITATTYVYSKRYEQPEAEMAYYRAVMDRLRATPGVESVAMTSILPMDGFDRRSLHREDRKLANEADAPSADTYSVSPDYFYVLRIPLRRGRLITARDSGGAPPVAVISESCARSQFRGEDPIGKHIQLGGRSDKKPWITIVGVVGDVRQYGLDQPSSMEVYIAQAQDSSFAYRLVARTTTDPARFENAVRAAFLETDRTQPVFRIQPLDAYLGAWMAERRFTLALLGVFGLLALALAAVGIYGVFSYTVSLRTRELGIRTALGAGRRELAAMVLRQGVRVIAPSLGLGFAVSLAATRALSSMLFEVKPGDLTTSAGVAVLLAAVALAAMWAPARRAASVDPLVALREE